MSTACFLPGTSSSTGSPGLPWSAGRSLRPGSTPASGSSPSRRTVPSAGTLRLKLARSCGRPRQPLHEPLDVGVRPGRSQCRRRAHPGSDDQVESLASRIADAVAVRRIGVSFDVTEAVSNIKSYGEGPVMIWFPEDYRDDVVLVV